MDYERLKTRQRNQRDQLRDCTNFMAKLVPLLIEIMMDHPGTLWGQGVYPVVK